MGLKQSRARTWAAAASFAALLWLSPFAAANAQTLAHKGWAGSGMTVDAWWEHALFYQADPLSFQDSDGDGFGDLNGLTGRLDYLGSLGVDALVLSPFPFNPATGGIDPKYGTQEDFDRLLSEAGRRRIRVVVDLPISASHTVEEYAGMARFWFSRGIAGLHLVQDPASPPSTSERSARVDAVRRIAGSFPGLRVVLADFDGAGLAPAVAYAVHHGRRARPASSPHAPAAAELTVRRALERLGAEGEPGLEGLQAALRPLSEDEHAGQSVLATDGPDRARSFDRLGDGEHDFDRAKALAAAQMLSRAGVLLYFGQEVGMETTPGAQEVSQGGEPTPMQWGDLPLEASRQAGFTSATPWLAMGRNAGTANVSAEDADAASLLNWYRRLSALRHGSAALRSGSMDFLPTGQPDVIAWVRRAIRGGEPADVVVINLSGRPVQAHPGGIAMLHIIAQSSEASADQSTSRGTVQLPPYGVLIGQLPRSAP